ncbi:MAG: hypothetical protein SVW51_13695 [Pseudomonadota bacterium]|nr:hypothetical protein [Pseudomonadota bacterium]
MKTPTKLVGGDLGLSSMPSYTEQTALFYNNIYFPKVAKTLEQQGFVFTDNE